MAVRAATPASPRRQAEAEAVPAVMARLLAHTSRPAATRAATPAPSRAGKGGAGGESGGGTWHLLGGDGGDVGGVGVQFTTTGATFTNSGIVAGGNGGAAGGAGEAGSAGSAGAGGAGIVGAGLTIIDSNTIRGGLGGNGVTRADAIEFTGGTNTLTLEVGYSIVGNVVAYSTADTLALGGIGTATFDVSLIGASAQHGRLRRSREDRHQHRSLTGATTAATAWTIYGGTLDIAALGAAGTGVDHPWRAGPETLAVESPRRVIEPQLRKQQRQLQCWRADRPLWVNFAQVRRHPTTRRHTFCP